MSQNNNISPDLDIFLVQKIVPLNAEKRSLRPSKRCLEIPLGSRRMGIPLEKLGELGRATRGSHERWQ